MSAVRTVLHIGSDKTGSTALQHALAAARPELANRGILYPDLDGRPDHLGYARGDRPDWQLGADIDTFIVSSEALWPLGPEHIEAVVAGLPDGPTEVVAYVREPGAYAEAAFVQRCRMCTSERRLRAAVALVRLPPAVNPIARRAVRRFAQLELWAEMVDRGIIDRLVLRPYQPERWPAGDIVGDFWTAIGRDDVAPLFADRADRVQNPTPDLLTIHASVLIRASGGPKQQARFLRWVNEDARTSASSRTQDGPYLGSPLRAWVRRAALPPLAELHARHGGLESLLGGMSGEGSEAAEPPGQDRRPTLDRDAALQLVARFANLNNPQDDRGGQR